MLRQTRRLAIAKLLPSNNCTAVGVSLVDLPAAVLLLSRQRPGDQCCCALAFNSTFSAGQVHWRGGGPRDDALPLEAVESMMLVGRPSNWLADLQTGVLSFTGALARRGR